MRESGTKQTITNGSSRWHRQMLPTAALSGLIFKILKGFNKDIMMHVRCWDKNKKTTLTGYYLYPTVGWKKSQTIINIYWQNQDTIVPLVILKYKNSSFQNILLSLKSQHFLYGKVNTLLLHCVFRLLIYSPTEKKKHTLRSDLKDALKIKFTWVA